MKKKLFFIIKCFLAIGIMAYLIHKIEYETVLRALQNPFQPGWLIAACILLIPNLFIQWYRWHYLLKLIGPHIKKYDSISSFFGGLVVGIITPGRLGEMGRPLFLRNINRMQAFGLVLIDRLYAIFPVIVGGMWGLIMMFCHLSEYSLYILLPLILLGVIITLVIILIALHPNSIRSFLYQLSLILPFRDKLKQILLCFKLFQKREAQKYIFFSSIFYSIYIIQFSFLAFAFQKFSLYKALLATTSTMLAKALLPISFADFGIREGAAIFFFKQLFVDKVTAFNSALLLFGINVFIPTLIGLFFLPKLQFHQDEIKED